MDIAIIGGGAAGFFAAIAAKENYPDAQVVIFEKSNQCLAKVKLSGGGRCNLTNGCASIKELIEAYPRGGNALKKAFYIFNATHTKQWFESRGVALMMQQDQRVFPASQSSHTIVDCFLHQAKRLGIVIELGCAINALAIKDSKITVQCSKKNIDLCSFDKVIVATGGCPEYQQLMWLETLGHSIEPPVPSLFTFNMPDESITALTGVAVEHAIVRIPTTKYGAEGPVLITHWGMSGPAILTLSAHGARYLSERNYNFNVQINWANEHDHDVVMKKIKHIVDEHKQKMIANIRPYFLPERLWLYMLEKSNISRVKKWGELAKKEINKVVSVLTNDIYDVQGKTMCKDEFVTCGGVSLKSIDMHTMQSKVCKNLYFAGEVMDIDGLSGGYNFQAAWTTAFIAGQLK